MSFRESIERVSVTAEVVFNEEAVFLFDYNPKELISRLRESHPDYSYRLNYYFGSTWVEMRLGRLS